MLAMEFFIAVYTTTLAQKESFLLGQQCQDWLSYEREVSLERFHPLFYCPRLKSCSSGSTTHKETWAAFILIKVVTQN